MLDKALLKEKLEQILEALLRVQKRFSKISSPEDFMQNETGLDLLDSIAMMLIAVGENFKNIDIRTSGLFLEKYPDIDWKGVKGLRDVLSHNYISISIMKRFIIFAKTS